MTILLIFQCKMSKNSTTEAGGFWGKGPFFGSLLDTFGVKNNPKK